MKIQKKSDSNDDTESDIDNNENDEYSVKIILIVIKA